MHYATREHIPAQDVNKNGSLKLPAFARLRSIANTICNIDKGTCIEVFKTYWADPKNWKRQGHGKQPYLDLAKRAASALKATHTLTQLENISKSGSFKKEPKYAPTQAPTKTTTYKQNKCATCTSKGIKQCFYIEDATFRPDKCVYCTSTNRECLHEIRPHPINLQTLHEQISKTQYDKARKERHERRTPAHVHTITVYQQKQILDQAIRILDGLPTQK